MIPKPLPPFKFCAILRLCLLLALLAGCGEDEPPAVTATPVATTTTAVNARVPDATSLGAAGLPAQADTPQTTGAATPTPEEQFADGLRQHQYGNYSAARTIYATLLEPQAGGSPLPLHVKLALARAYFADGMNQEALATLVDFEDKAAHFGAISQELLPKAAFLRAELLMAQGEYQLAVEQYQNVLRISPWAEEAVQLRLTSAWSALGNTANMIAAYRSAIAATSDTASKAQLLEALAQIYNNEGRHSDAIASYDEILSIARKPDYRASIQYLAGQTFAYAGDEAQAIKRWQAAALGAPENRVAYQSLIELVNRNVNVDLYQRGYIDLKAQAWFPAIEAFQGYINTTKATDSRFGPALLGVGQSQAGASNYSAAIATFDRIITDFPGCTCFGQAWLEKARTQIVSGDVAIGRRTYRTFAREYPKDPLAAEALWLSGVNALRNDNRLEAAADFLLLADAFPQSQQAPFALYVVATGAMQSQLYGEAIELYSRIQQEHPTERWDAAGYWLGRAYQADGDQAQANRSWQAVVDRVPGTYYAVLSLQALQKRPTSGGAFLQNVSAIVGDRSRLAGDDGSQQFAEAWIAQQRPLSITTLVTMPVNFLDDPDFLQGRLLLEIDRSISGLAFLGRVYERNKDSLPALYRLSLAFEQIGANQLSIYAMQRLLQLLPKLTVEDLPIFLQQHIYPRPYADLIIKEANAKQIDPLLYFSLLRQESMFEGRARSGAAAQGLAQIIPDTAEWVAQQIGHPEWSNELIYRPYINLQFGAYYLAWARNYLDDNLVSALVGYNAGPGNAEAWREISGDDDALFVELLSVNEPRVYIHTITTNLYHYTRLYGQR